MKVFHACIRHEFMVQKSERLVDAFPLLMMIILTSSDLSGKTPLRRHEPALGCTKQYTQIFMVPQFSLPHTFRD